MMDLLDEEDKIADRKARAILQNKERAERTDLEQLILLYTNPKRGNARREKEKLIKKIRNRYAGDPQAFAAVKAELKKHKISI
ncbi:MAG: hypothetical protein CL524_01105 [Aequorivita sp.]|jgi:hypothetical protein|nr:hypothetical protein [Aequorivita sp.]